MRPVRVALLAVLFASGCAEVESSGSGGAGPGDGGTVPDGGDMGCPSNFDCDESEYCAGDMCGGLGVCTERPSNCPLNVAFVCGCDRLTYDNACQAAQAGVRVAADGRCACSDNDDCVDDEYCAGEVCGGEGLCAERPSSCPLVFDPVCGCDEVTYDNECLSQQAGTTVEKPCTCDDTCDTDCRAQGCEGDDECRACAAQQDIIWICLPPNVAC